MTQYSQLARDLQGAAIQFSALASSASAFGGTVNVFREFERQLTLTGAAAGATAQQFRDMENATKRFSLAASAGATESASALYFLSQAGFDASESLSAMTGVLLLAQASMADTGFVADLLASTIQSYGLAAQDATRISNLFQAANVNSLASLDKLAYSFRQVGPVAALAGQSIEETTAYLANLYDIGLRGEQAGTALRNIIVRLTAPVGEARKILSEFGIATVDAGGSMRELEAILTDINQQGFGTETLSKLFGAEALAGGVALLDAVEGGYQDMKAAISGTNAAFEQSQKQIQTLDGQLKLAGNSLNYLAIEIGERLTPAVRAVTSTIIEGVRWFDALDEGTQSLLIGVGATSIAVFGLTTTAGLLLPILIQGVRQFGFLYTGLTKIPGAAANIASGFTAIRATVASTVASLPALAAGFSAAYTNFLLFSGAILSIVGLPVLIGTAVVAVGGLALAWDQVSKAADRAKRQQQSASDFGAGGLDLAIGDINTAIQSMQQSLSSLPYLYSEEGAGPSDMAGATTSILNSVLGQFEAVKEARQKILDEISSIENIDELQSDANHFGGDFGRFVDHVFNPPSEEDIDNAGKLEGARARLDALDQQYAELSATLQDGVTRFQQARTNIIENLRTDAGSVLPALANQQGLVDAAFSTQGFADSLSTAIDATTADNEVSAGEISDAIIAVFSQFDTQLATALAPELTLAKTLASLEEGQGSYAAELRKIEIAIQKRVAAATDDIAAAYDADIDLAGVELGDDLSTAQEKLAEIIKEALGSNEIMNGVFPVLDAAGNTTATVGLVELVNQTALFEQLRSAAAAGADDSQLTEIANRVSAENKATLDALLTQLEGAGKIDENTVEQLRVQFELSGRSVMNAIDAFSVGLIEANDENEKKRQQAITAAKKAADLTKTLAILRLESQRNLIEAQQGVADQGSFSFGSDLARGLTIIDLEYQQNLAKIEARMEQEAAALGEALSPEEAANIKQRYVDAARITRDAAEGELILELRQQGIEISREIEDVFIKIGTASTEARRTIFENGGFGGGADFMTQAFGLDVQDITQRYQAQITDLLRQQQDLMEQFRGQPEVLSDITSEYGTLINEVQEAMRAELEYTNTFEAMTERRAAAIDAVISKVRDAALTNGTITDQFVAGINIAILEAQRDANNLVDLTAEGFTTLKETAADFLADTIFDSENAFENLGKTLETFARDITSKVLNNSLDAIMSGFLPDDQQDLANAGAPQAYVDPVSINNMATTIATAIQTVMTPLVNAATVNTSGGIGAYSGGSNAVGGSYSLPANIEAIIDQTASGNAMIADYLKRIAYVESRGNPLAQNPNSSAGGLFQFTNDTANQYGLTDKMDPVASTEAAMRLLSDNIAGLTQLLGRTPTAGEAYLAHQQGLGGATSLLANPGGRAVDSVGYDAVNLNGGNANMTNQQFADLWISKVDGMLTPTLTTVTQQYETQMTEGSQKIGGAMTQAAENIGASAQSAVPILDNAAVKVQESTQASLSGTDAAFNALAVGISGVSSNFLGAFGPALQGIIGVLSGGDGLGANLGNIFSSIFGGGAGVGHVGGMVGALPYYHKGGLLSGERLVVAKEEEGIFTPEQMTNAGRILNAAMQPRELKLANADRSMLANNRLQTASNDVVINNYGSPDRVEVTETENSKGGHRTEVTIQDTMAGALSTPGSSARNVLKSQFGLRNRVTKR